MLIQRVRFDAPAHLAGAFGFLVVTDGVSALHLRYDPVPELACGYHLIDLDYHASALRAIDAAALALDEKYLTCGGQQGQVYDEKATHARAYKAANYPVLAEPLDPQSADYAAYGYVRAYRSTLRVTNENATDQEAADAILAQARACAIDLGVVREDIRLTAKARVRAATTPLGIDTIVAQAVTQLGAL